MKKISSTTYTAATVWMILLTSPPLFGAELSVTNGSFEDITGQTEVNEFTLVTPNGWDSFNTNGLIEGSGLYLGTLETDGTFFDPATNPAPDGSRVAILYNQTQKGAGEYGIQQTLPDTLQPFTQYTLQVEVGNIGSGTADSGGFYDLSGFPGYRIDLMAGTTVLASDSNSLTIAERTFETSTILVAPNATHPAMGEPLTIRLVSLNLPLEPDSNSSPYDAHEVDFDDVRLFADPITTSNRTPYSLMVSAGLVASNATPAEFETASLLDSDLDTHLDWQEYITGTDPSNALSYFATQLQTSNGIPTLSWSTISNRSYYVEWSTNLTTGFSTPTPAPSGNYTDTDATNRPGTFYRILVTTP